MSSPVLSNGVSLAQFLKLRNSMCLIIMHTERSETPFPEIVPRVQYFRLIRELSLAGLPRLQGSFVKIVASEGKPHTWFNARNGEIFMHALR